jgi:hypothetical protein
VEQRIAGARGAYSQDREGTGDQHRRRGERASGCRRLPVPLPAVYRQCQERLQAESEEAIRREQGGEGARVARVGCEPPEQECGARRIDNGMRTAVKNEGRNPLLSTETIRCGRKLYAWRATKQQLRRAEPG